MEQRQPSYQKAVGTMSPDERYVNIVMYEPWIHSTLKNWPLNANAKFEFVLFSLPDLNAADVANAAVKIQAAFKGHKARKQVKEQKDLKAKYDDLPDLQDKAVQDATIKIQSAFKGFNVRKQKQEETKAALLIQRNFRGYVFRKKSEKAFAATVEAATAAIKIQKVYRWVLVTYLKNPHKRLTPKSLHVCKRPLSYTVLII